MKLLEMFSNRSKWDVDLISISNPEELKKVCNTILKKDGTLSLQDKLQTFYLDVVELYDVTADLKIRELFGSEFVDENQYQINALYNLHTDLETQEAKCEYLCGCYEQWIMQWKNIFPKY
jgi:hypothetical protein